MGPFPSIGPSAIPLVGSHTHKQTRAHYCILLLSIAARASQQFELVTGNDRTGASWSRGNGLPLPDDLHRWSRWASSRGHPSEELPTSAESLLLYCSQFWYQNLVRTGDSLHQDKPVKTNLCVWDSFAKFSSRLFFFFRGKWCTSGRPFQLCWHIFGSSRGRRQHSRRMPTTLDQCTNVNDWHCRQGSV